MRARATNVQTWRVSVLLGCTSLDLATSDAVLMRLSQSFSLARLPKSWASRSVGVVAV